MSFRAVIYRCEAFVLEGEAGEKLTLAFCAPTPRIAAGELTLIFRDPASVDGFERRIHAAADQTSKEHFKPEEVGGNLVTIFRFNKEDDYDLTWGNEKHSCTVSVPKDMMEQVVRMVRGYRWSVWK